MLSTVPENKKSAEPHAEVAEVSPTLRAADHALVPRGLLSALPDEQPLAMRRLP